MEKGNGAVKIKRAIYNLEVKDIFNIVEKDNNFLFVCGVKKTISPPIPVDNPANKVNKNAIKICCSKILIIYITNLKKIKVRITSTKINILKIPRIFCFSGS